MNNDLAHDVRLLRIPSRSFGEREVAIYGELSQDHNPIHSDKEFAAKTSFAHPIVYGFLFVMPVWDVLQRVYGHKAFSPGKAIIRFLRPLLVGQTAHYAVEAEQVTDGISILFTVRADGTEPIATVQAFLPVTMQARSIH